MNIDFLDYEIKEALSKSQNQEDLLRVLESLEKIYSMKISIQNEIKRNVSYPISILSFLTLLIVFIQIYVIPKIAELTNTEMKLFITPIIIFNIYSLIFISLILFKLNNKFENVILRIPMLKDLYKTKILLIFSQSMYLLLSSTKNIVLSLNKILNSTESNLLKEEILSIISLLESGRNLKEIFEDYHGEFPELKIYGLILSSNGDAKDVFRMLSENLNFRLKKFYQFIGKFSEPLLMLLVGTAILELAYELYVSILNQFGAIYP